MDEPLDPGDIRNTRPSDARPFVIALVGFLIVAVAAFFFLREDAELHVFPPDAVERLDDDTVRATGLFGPCEAIERAQVDFDDDTVFVELVARDLGDCDCDDDCAESEYELRILLPEPIDGRRLVPGIGRLELPCTDSTCRADQ